MKVLLIQPPTTFEQIYGEWDLSALDTYMPNLGLLHIASYIRDNNHEPHIFDLQILNWKLDEAVDRILQLNPDIIGLSAMTINCMNAARIASELRKKHYSSPIILGGPHITAVPVETLTKFNAIDYGVIGEGEVTFLELIEKIQRTQHVDDVQGIVRREESGTVVLNSQRPLIDNLDMLPLPAWDLLKDFPKKYPSNLLESKNLPATTVMTSRGCPFHCTFCDHRVFGSKVRHFSAEYSLNMIRHLKTKFGIKDLLIFDDNFLIDKKKLFHICNAMIAEKMNLTWFCQGHAKFMTEDRLKIIKEAGCWFVEIGIESGNNIILDRIKKNTNKNEIENAVKEAKKAGLKVKGNFIFGFPGDTTESIKESIQFALDLDIDFFQQTFLTVWPGCEIYRQISDGNYDYNYYEDDWDKIAHHRITFVPAGLTKKDLSKFSKEAFRKFYFRPKTMRSFLPLLTSYRGIKIIFIGFFTFLRTIFRKIELN